MKTFLALLLTASVSFAASPVVVEDVTRIIIINAEGRPQNAGCLEDVLANYPAKATEVKDAVKAFVEAMKPDQAVNVVPRVESKGIPVDSTFKAKVAVEDAKFKAEPTRVQPVADPAAEEIVK